VDPNRKAISGEAVVVLVLEAMESTGFIGYDQAAGFEEGELLRVCGGGSIAAHNASPEMSNAPIWALLGGLARIVALSIGITAWGVNGEKEMKFNAHLVCNWC
jgi:hypothetical protein